MLTRIIVAIVGVVLATVVTKMVFRLFWPRSDHWAVNTSPTACPNCHEPTPDYRTPANRRELLWGGFTCTECGTRCDKFGREPDIG